MTHLSECPISLLTEHPIYINIKIVKTALLEPQTCLEESAIVILSWDLNHPVFYFSGFRKNNIFQSKSSTLHAIPNLEDQVSVFTPPVTEWPLIHSGTGFHFRRLLRLAGSQWRCFNAHPRGESVCVCSLQISTHLYLSRARSSLWLRILLRRHSKPRLFSLSILKEIRTSH
jgi:hypothetical protein